MATIQSGARYFLSELIFTLKMEAILSFETWGYIWTTRLCIPEDVSIYI
jgi:hypothetical protein